GLPRTLHQRGGEPTRNCSSSSCMAYSTYWGGMTRVIRTGHECWPGRRNYSADGAELLKPGIELEHGVERATTLDFGQRAPERPRRHSRHRQLWMKDAHLQCASRNLELIDIAVVGEDDFDEAGIIGFQRIEGIRSLRRR